MKVKDYKFSLALIVLIVVGSAIVGATVSGAGWYRWGDGMKVVSPKADEVSTTSGAEVVKYLSQSCGVYNTAKEQDCVSRCADAQKTCISAEVLEVDDRRTDNTGLIVPCETKLSQVSYNCFCC